MSQHPGRMSSKFTGSTLTNSRLRPATAFIATWVKRWPSNSQSWCPNSFSTIRGARSAYLAGHPALEHVGRLDEMVVDRDDRVADRSRLRVGQQGLGSGDDRHLRSLQIGSQRGARAGYADLRGWVGANTNRETSPVPLIAPPTEGPLVRRFCAILAVVAVALVGSTTFASAATGPAHQGHGRRRCRREAEREVPQAVRRNAPARIGWSAREPVTRWRRATGSCSTTSWSTAVPAPSSVRRSARHRSRPCSTPR